MCLIEAKKSENKADKVVYGWKIFRKSYKTGILDGLFHRYDFSIDKWNNTGYPGFHVFNTRKGARGYKLKGEVIYKVACKEVYKEGFQEVFRDKTRVVPAFACLKLKILEKVR